MLSSLSAFRAQATELFAAVKAAASNAWAGGGTRAGAAANPTTLLCGLLSCGVAQHNRRHWMLQSSVRRWRWLRRWRWRWRNHLVTVRVHLVTVHVSALSASIVLPTPFRRKRTLLPLAHLQRRRWWREWCWWVGSWVGQVAGVPPGTISSSWCSPPPRFRWEQELHHRFPRSAIEEPHRNIRRRIGKHRWFDPHYG